MARIPRIKIEDEDTLYHIGARVAGSPMWFPFDDPVARHQLEELICFYTEAYSCKVASFSLMSNHYHLLLRFEAFRQLSRIELEERAALLYPSPEKVLVSDRDWERFNRRLFDLSELMRNIQGDYAKWYNRNYGRRGPCGPSDSAPPSSSARKRSRKLWHTSNSIRYERTWWKDPKTIGLFRPACGRSEPMAG